MVEKNGRQASRPKNDPPPRRVRNGPHKQPRWYFEGALTEVKHLDRMFKRYENDNGRLQFPEFACLVLPDGFGLPNFGNLDANHPEKPHRETLSNFKITQAIAYLSSAGLNKENEDDDKDKRKPDDAKKKRKTIPRQEKPPSLGPQRPWLLGNAALAGNP